MDDLNERVRSELERLTPSADGLERTLRRVRRRRSRRRLAAGLVGMALTVALGAGLWTIANETTKPIPTIPRPKTGVIRSGVIVYVTGDKSRSIFRVGLEGTTRLGSAAAGCCVGWFGGGNLVAYPHGISEGQGSLIVRNLQTGVAKTIAEQRNEVYNEPTMSPDSKEIAFVSSSAYLEVIRPDGSGLRRLFDKPPYCGVGFISWSPDASSLVYEFSCFPGRSYRTATDSIEVIRADGTGRHAILGPGPAVPQLGPVNYAAADYSMPAWSPDGTRIAFVENREISSGREQQIWVMNADGSNVVELVHGDLNAPAPVWSPDGTQIGFTQGPGDNQQIYLMNADGSGLFQLTNVQHGVTYFAWVALPGPTGTP